MRLLMAHRVGRGEEEAEPVIVDVRDQRAILLLDDGEEVELDLEELREILNSAYDR